MYEPKRMDYRLKMAPMQPNTPVESALNSAEAPLDGTEGGDYFNFEDGAAAQQWPGPQSQQPMLDPVEELERDLLEFDSQFPSVQQVPLDIDPEMSAQLNARLKPQGSAQMTPHLASQLHSQMNSQMGSRMGSHIGSQMGSQMGSNMGSNMISRNSSRIGSQASSRIGSSLSTPLNAPMTSRLNPQLDPHLAPQMSSLGTNAQNRVNSHLDPRLNSQLHLQLGAQLNSQMSSQMNPHLNPHMNPHMNSQINTRVSPQIQHQLNPELLNHMQAPLQGPISLADHESIVGIQRPLSNSHRNRVHGSPQVQLPQSSHSPQMVNIHASSNQSRTSSQASVVDGPSHTRNLLLDEVKKSRDRYKAQSSIPPDLSSANYAAQCIAAAESSRLSPYHLSLGEYSHLRVKLPRVHVTTYLNIRNGILRLWLANPLVAVTIVEAAGCCKDIRYFKLAEFAFEWLLRNGHINQGCCTHQGRYSSSIAALPKFSNNRRKPRQTIAVIGAGIAGLSCARQLENLLERYSTQILAEYEDLPRVLVLEGRKRLGGRVYSPTLSTERMAVDLGGGTISGFGGGNPLGIVLRRQLGIPVVSIDTTGDENVLYDGDTGDPITPQVDYRAHEMFKYLLDRMRSFEMGLGTMSQPPASAPGVKTLIRAGQDPPLLDPEQEKVTIAQFEEDTERPYSNQSSSSQDDESEQEVKVELDFLESLGFTTKTSADKDIRLHAEPSAQNASLGLTMARLMEHLSSLTDLNAQDQEALNWYLAKFEYTVGDDIDKACLSSWSHHRSNRFTGRHAWTRDGMSTFTKGLDTVPNKLDVRFKTVANVIEYEEDSAQITLENGEQVFADRCVVTTPLGCLKRRSMQFIPDLPQWKLDSIDRLEFGVVNKVVLVFDEPFWDSTMPSIIRVTAGASKEDRGNCFVFQNHSRRGEMGGKALIVGLLSGLAAKQITESPDFEIVERAVEKLRRVFKSHPKAQTTKLVESIVTRWQVDRFSRGAFSHVGVDGTVTDHDLLARPVLRSLFFAGEATSRTFPGTMHGAYLSGLRAAKEVLNSLVGGIEVPDNLFVDKAMWASEHSAAAAEQRRDKSEGSDLGETNGPLMNTSLSHRETQSLHSHHYHGDADAVPPSSGIPNTGPIYSLEVAAAKANGHPDMDSHLDSGLAMNQGRMVSRSVPGSLSVGPEGEDYTVGSSHHEPDPEAIHALQPMDYTKAEAELTELRNRRESLEREQLERDMMHEIGKRPEKPDRHGTTNPFLLFQKDYWDICRQETEAAKRKDKKSGQAHASRNEIRASLGKKWRSLPEDKRAPYIERSQQAKVENEERQEAFLRKLKWYESEAANFKQQWVQEHPNTSSLRERQLEEQLEGYRPRRKRSRLTE